MTINSSSGVVSWFPDDDEGPLTDTADVTVRCADGGEDGVSPDEVTYTINITQVNDAPVIAAIADDTVTEYDTYTYTPAATDQDSPQSQLQWSFVEKPHPDMTIDLDSGAISWRPENQETGGTVTIRVTDVTGGEPYLFDDESFVLTVTPVNDPPVLVFPSPVPTATEDTSYTTDIDVTDIDDTSGFVFSQVGTWPAEMNINADSGVISWSEPGEEGGSVTVAVRVTDPGGESDERDLTIPVNQINDAPRITSTPVTTAVEGSPYVYTAVVEDPDDDNNGLDLQWVLLNKPDDDMYVTELGEVRWLPPNGITSAPVTLRVIDGGEHGAQPFDQEFTIIVTEVNTPPELTAPGDQAATENVLMELELEVRDDDDANNGTSLFFTLGNEPAGMEVSPTGVITWRPENGQGDALDIEISVEDGNEDDSVPEVHTFDVTVTPVNDPPVIAAIENDTAMEGEPYAYTATATDQDNEQNELNWSLGAGAPEGMVINAIGEITWLPGDDPLPEYNITVIVSDGELTDQTIYTIAVTPVNDAPVIAAIADQGISEDDAYRFTATATDADNPQTDFIWSLGAGAPEEMAIDSDGEITWIPVDDPLPQYNLTVVVSDGELTDETTYTLAVTPVNDPPVINTEVLPTARETLDYTAVLDINDPDDTIDELEVSLTDAPEGMEIEESAGTRLITWTPPEGTRTSGEFTLTVADGRENGAEPDTRQFTVEVFAYNTPPEIVSEAGTEATEDILYEYLVVVDDLDDPNPAADLTFTLVNAPAGDQGLMEVDEDGLITWTPLEGVLTSGEVTLIVADFGEDEAEPAIERFTINVTPVNDAPRITTTAPEAAVESKLYTYEFSVEDPENGELTYILRNAPDNMAMEGQTISWIPDEGTRTSGEVTLEVVDDAGASTTELFTITVTEFNTPPIITSRAPRTATEEVLYEYPVVVDDIDDYPTGLSYRLYNEPDGMDVTPEGVVTWRPEEGVTTSGEVTLEVSDGGENDALPDIEIFTVAVARINDGPVIRSEAPTTANEDEPFNYQLIVEDPDDELNGSDLAFTLSNEPDGMSVSPLGVITWWPDENSPLTSTVTVMVSDGGEHNALPDTQTFTLTVLFDIDNDGVPNDDDNCRYIANDQANNDGDDEGDACDADDDNDTMPDEFELAHGLDPFNPADADADPDGDGVSNVDEYRNGGNPNADDIAPVITEPLNILRFSTSFETYIDIGQAIATDSLNGPLPATPSRPSGRFRTGRHVITWSATDNLGNTSTAQQIIDVIPQLSIAVGQQVEEGKTAEVALTLNGAPVRYPVSVDYVVTGTADANDHSLADGTLELDGIDGTLQFDVLADTVPEGVETVEITLSNPRNAILGGNSSHVVEIVETNVAPKVSLTVTQNDIPSLIVNRPGGPVVVTAEVEDPNVEESFTYDWSGSDNALTSEAGLNGRRFVFDPPNVASGIYKLKVAVTDSGGATVSNEVVIQVTEVVVMDTDANSIADAVDKAQVRFVLQAETQADFLETEPDLYLRLGETAIRDGADGTAVTLEAIGNLGDAGLPVNVDTDHSFDAGLYDYVVHGLSRVGQSVWVVIPQLQPLPESAVYRQFRVDSGWRDFTVDANNAIASVKAVAGVCPAPGAQAYEPGLAAGADCVQLLIEDGGPNDADGEANGTIRDLGGAGVAPGTRSGGSDQPARGDGDSGGGGGGGGTTTLGLLLSLMLLLACRGLVRRNRKAMLE